VILSWDNLNTHISAAMRAFIEAHPGWLTEARLPDCAPDLNAVEAASANMKIGLGNFAPSDVDQITAVIKNSLRSIQHRPPTSCNRCRQPRLDRVKTGLHRSSITAQQATLS
jgi:putative transposase